MASDYPGGIDSFDTIASDKKTSDSVGGRTHRAMHNDLGDAIEAVQTELGTDPSGTYSTVKARFEAIEGSTLPQIDAKGDLIVGTADNTYDNLGVGTNDTVLVADSAQAKGVKWAQVPTAGIADSAVTSAKIAAGTIVAADIANDTITATQIAANAVGSSELADNAVDTAAIADSAVTTAKIADAAVTAAKLAVQPGNLLTDNQAKPTTTGAWSILSSVTEGSAGVYSPTGAGAASTSSYITGLTAGETYTLRGKLTMVGRVGRVAIFWRDSGGATISTVSGSAVSAGATGVSALTAVAPVGTASARVFPFYSDNGNASGDTATTTEVSLHRGAGGTFVLPGAPVPGTSRIAVNNAVDLSGTGSPEGVVTAAPGSTWLQTDSTTDVKGWIKWVKATGTGNTGWVAGPEADTGWRKATVSDTAIFYNSTYNSANPNSVFYMRRQGGQVSVKFSTGTSPTFTTDWQSVVLIPTGWRPVLDSTTATLGPDMPLFDTASGALVTKTLVFSSGENTQMRNAGSWASGGRYRGGVSWSTSDAWPSSLPAVAYP